MKAVVFTLGCKVNRYESDCLAALLASEGYDVSVELEKADVYIINSCAVTKEAERKSRQILSKIKKLNSNAKVVFIGCASVDAKNLDGKIELVKNSLNIKSDRQKFYAMRTRARSLIKIQDGCNNFCSYCIVPYLRGRSCSRDMKEILDEIMSSEAKEIVLTGVNISAYNYEGLGVANLIDNVAKKFFGRIRLGSLEVRVVDEHLLEVMANHNVCDHFHLSLQSGSDEVLKAMNRKYSIQEYLNKIELIRKYFPYAGITTDIICGYPTETDLDFIKTLTAVKQAEFSDIHVFPYSRRTGTAAEKLPLIDSKIVKDRVKRLSDIKHECQQRFLEKNEGRVLPVLFEQYEEGYSSGYTPNYIKIFLKGAPLWTVSSVKLSQELSRQKPFTVTTK